MRREDAIEILSRIWGGDPQLGLANKYTDAFVALGILKLEDSNGIEKLAPAMKRMGYSANCAALRDLEAALDFAGLKIVDAKP